MADISKIVESLGVKQRSIVNSNGVTPEGIEELSEYALHLYRAAVSEAGQPEKIRAEILRRLALDASLDSMSNGKASLSLFFAAMPILFDNGQDPDKVPSVTVAPIENPWPT